MSSICKSVGILQLISLMTSARLLFVLMLVTAITNGCDGGSSSSGGQNTTLLSGSAAEQAVGLSGYQSFRAQADFPYAAVRLGLPATSPFVKAGKLISRLSSITYISELNLYESISTQGNTETVNFFTDPSGVTSAGSMILTVPTGTIGNYTTYPQTISVVVNITAGNILCSGSGSITYTGPTGANTMKGNLILKTTNISIDFNLTLSSTGVVGGSATIVENGATISMTNINGPLSGNITGNVTVAPYGWTGTCTFSLVDGSFSYSLNILGSVSSAATNASHGLDFKFENGQTETITNPLTTQPSTPPSSGGGTSSGYTLLFPTGSVITARNSLGNFATTTDQSLTSGTPYIPGFLAVGSTTPQPLQLNGFARGDVFGINNKNELVGILGTAWNFDPALQHQGAYWSSPTAMPQILQPLSGDIEVDATAINNNGEIVGFSQNSAGIFHPVYYSSPSAAPKALSVTGINPTFTRVVPVAINNHSEIIGNYTFNGNYSLPPVATAYVWATPASNPVALSLPAGDTSVEATALNDSGKIVGSSWPSFSSTPSAQHALLWASASAQPTVLAGLSGDVRISANDINTSGQIIGTATSVIGGAYYVDDSRDYLQLMPTDHMLLWNGGSTPTQPPSGSLFGAYGGFISDNGTIAQGDEELVPK